MLIGDVLRRQAAPTGRPDKTALICGADALTYRALNAAANAVANGLLHLGLKRGDRVALLGRNSLEWVIVYYAAAKCGAILVPVNFWYRAGELAYVLRDSTARFCFLAGAFHSVAAAAAADEPRSVEHWIWLDGAPDGSGALPGAMTLDTLTRGVDDDEPSLADGKLHETGPHIILYTSGTTGFPKGAVLSHRAHVDHAATFALYTGAGEEDVYLNVYPLFHTGGTDCAVLPYHYAGATVALLPDPKPDAVLDAIEMHRVTAMMAVPTIWRRLIEAPGIRRRDLSAFRRAMGSSDAMPLDLLREVIASFGATWTQTYGLTEAGCILTYLRPADQERKLGSAGKPHVQADLAVADPARSDESDWPECAFVSTGEVGEIVARTQHAAGGYWGKPEQTAAALRPGRGRGGRWLRTGDLGYLDDEGYLYIAGRLKDVVISGGEKIYPAEVEPVLREYPGLAEVALVGVPDQEWGESVLAVVVPGGGEAFDREAFKRWARTRVAGFKTPRHVVVVDELPRTTGTGKVQKAILRQRFAYLGRDAASQAPPLADE